MRRIALALMLLLPIGTWAQEKKEEPKPEQTSKVFEVRPGNVERITGALRNLVGHDAVKTDRNLGMIVVRTQPELMPAVEQVVRRLDTAVPIPNNVEITVFLLEASREPAAGASIPAELQPTVAQLRNIFAYQNFQLLDTAVLRSRSMQTANVNGVLSVVSFGKDFTLPYQVRLRPMVQTDDKARSIRIDDLRFATQVPVDSAGHPRVTASIEAEIDVREGQKVVVGKTGLEGTKRALILVLSGKIVD
jgi:uncharacterized Zn-finger protein